MMSASTAWIKVASLPEDRRIGTFIIFFDEQSNSLYTFHSTNGLYKYSFDINSWNKYITIQNDLNPFFFNTRCPTSAINCNTNTIYIYGGNLKSLGKLKITDNENKWDVTDNLIESDVGAQAIIINDEFHVIGGYKSNKHLKYMEQTKQFKVLHSFDTMFPTKVEEFGLHRLVKVKNKLLMFGGFSIISWECTNRICQYDITENQWTELNVKMPDILCFFGCTSILYDQYVVIFGGKQSPFKPREAIWIYSIEDKTFISSQVECPKGGELEAITINDRSKDELAVNGFIRKEWSISESFLPNDLIEMIHSYYLNEWVHLFHCESGEHWKIDVFDVIKNVL